MNIGILGTGDVGRVLGKGLSGLGHGVKIGSRDPHSDKLKQWIDSTGGRGSTGTLAEAAAYGDVVILATLWSGTHNALHLAGEHALKEKVVIDATNPLSFTAPGAPPTLALGKDDSGGEQVQRWIPEARVVKCFNIVGNSHMVNPTFPGGPPDMFICGNDEEAKRKVTGLLAELGWPAIDFGGIEASRLLEPLCILWVIYGFRTGTWNHAFKLLRK
jgi:8-hydroxy-5-deazaflavin:NADPH oxidoreductase